MGFFQVLLDPHREDPALGDRLLVGDAANLLQVGEFQFLQLAYFAWFGSELPEQRISQLFRRYMLNNEVPPWARHYARLIMSRDRSGQLDASDPRYHRYDHDYATAVPKGLRHFLLAVSAIALIMVSLFAAATLVAPQPTSLLPPFFDHRELTPAAPPTFPPLPRSDAKDGRSGGNEAAGR
jgi:hypothetical protein